MANAASNSICLALSGGGFRATLFHLGVIRFLYEHRRPGSKNSLLSEVSDIIGVSGGSIIAAHVVQNFRDYTGTPDEFTAAAKKLVDFTTVNLQRKILIGPRTPFKNHSRALRKFYGGKVFLSALNPAKSKETRLNPRLHLMVTDLATGNMSALSADGIRVFPGWAADAGAGSGQIPLCEPVMIDAPQLTIDEAVAASSAFPLLVTPFLPKQGDLGAPNGKDVVSRCIWADGGVYDNTGLDFAQRFLMQSTRQCNIVLASDAGKPFGESYEAPQRHGIASEFMGARVMQTIDVQMQRLAYFDKLRHSAFAASRNATFVDCSLQNFQKHSGETHDSSDDLIADLQGIRTDLDSFSGTEAYWLIRRGYVEAHRKWTRMQSLRIEHFQERPLDPFLQTVTQANTTGAVKRLFQRRVITDATDQKLKSCLRGSTSFRWASLYFLCGTINRHWLLSVFSASMCICICIVLCRGLRSLPNNAIIGAAFSPVVTLGFEEDDRLVISYADFVERSADDFKDNTRAGRWAQLVRDSDGRSVEWECWVTGGDESEGIFYIRHVSTPPDKARFDSAMLEKGQLFDRTLLPRKRDDGGEECQMVTFVGTLCRIKYNSVLIGKCKIIEPAPRGIK